jgi:hypothetical protein
VSILKVLGDLIKIITMASALRLRRSLWPRMGVQLRLLHCTPLQSQPAKTRLDLPTPTSPEPLGPTNASVQRESLAPTMLPTVPPRKWNAQQWNGPGRSPLGPDRPHLDPLALRSQVWRTVVDNPKTALRLRLIYNTPVPNTRRNPCKSLPGLPSLIYVEAVSCVINGVPEFYTTDDIKRLVPFDPTRYIGGHPVVEGQLFPTFRLRY